MGQWSRLERCTPRCFWLQFEQWEQDVYNLWLMSCHAEKYRDEHKLDKVAFSTDWTKYDRLVQDGHPAFDYPGWERWELVGLMDFISSKMNRSPGAQQKWLGAR